MDRSNSLTVSAPVVRRRNVRCKGAFAWPAGLEPATLITDILTVVVPAMLLVGGVKMGGGFFSIVVNKILGIGKKV